MFSHWSETHRQWLSLGHRAANQTQPIITLDRDYRNCVKASREIVLVAQITAHMQTSLFSLHFCKHLNP